MQDIIDRFDGQTTSQAAKVRAEPMQDHVLVWLLKWGPGVNNHPHVPVARVKQAGDAHKVVWLQGADDQPSDEAEYRDLDELFAAIDSAIRVRSAE